MLAKLRLFFLLPLVSAAIAADAKNCGCACCKGKEVCCCVAEETAVAKATARHSLRGVIVAVNAADSTLTVKHEAIAGVMPAMTMLFKVEAASLEAAKKGQTITATMSRQGDDWWLHDVKLVPRKQT